LINSDIKKQSPAFIELYTDRGRPCPISLEENKPHSVSEALNLKHYLQGEQMLEFDYKEEY